MKFKLLIAAILISVFSLTLISTTPLFAEDDDHYITSDHYFITKEKFTQGWIYVTLATLKTEATPQTKNEAEFITVRDGEEIWTKFYYKTRIADKTEIKRGLEVIACEVSDDEIYRAPQDKDEAFQNNWFMAKVTDVSDLFKGYVTVSGGYKIKIDNLRVVVKK
jgi:hypothetical protein